MAAACKPFDMFGKNRFLARGKTIKELLAVIYSQKNSEMKLIFLAPLPDEKFDCIVTSQTRWWETLESEINQRFNLIEKYETRGTDVVMVVVKVAPVTTALGTLLNTGTSVG